MANIALPDPETLAELVSILPDFDVEEVSVNLLRTKFDDLTAPDHAIDIASDLIEEAIQSAYGAAFCPPIGVWDGDRTSVSVSLNALDRDSYDDKDEYAQARADHAENKKQAKAAVAEMVRAVIKGVLAADPQPTPEATDDEWEEEDTSSPMTAEDFTKHRARRDAFDAAYDAALAAGSSEKVAMAAGDAAEAALDTPAQEAGQPNHEAQPEASAASHKQDVLRITHSLALGVVETFLGTDPAWKPEAPFHGMGEDGSFRTVLVVRAEGMPRAVTMQVNTRRVSGVAVRLTPEDGLFRVYDTVGAACAALDEMRRQGPEPDADTIATALLEAGFRTAPADIDGNPGFVIGDLEPTEAVHVATRPDGYAVGYVDGAWLQTTYMGMDIKEAVAAAMRTPAVIRMVQAERAMRAEGFHLVTTDGEGNMGFLSTHPISTLTADLTRPFMIGWTDAGYRLGYLGEGWMDDEAYYHGLSLGEAMHWAGYLYGESRARALARLLARSLRVNKNSSLQDFYTYKGELYVQRRKDTVSVYVQVCPVEGATVHLTTYRGEARGVRRDMTCLRTHEDWNRAVKAIQEQVDDLAYGKMFA